MATGGGTGPGLNLQSDLTDIVEDISSALTDTPLSLGMINQRRDPGRPKVDIDVEEMEYLKTLKFSNTRISELIGVSRSTLYRRMELQGIDIRKTYTNITNSELDSVLQSIKPSHPNDGERLLIGHLHRLNVTVPRHRVRASIHRVDPINTAIRRSVTVQRRVYHVEGPNSLWHIDGHHKLTKWWFVTHGGIDGFSRTIVYLRCSTNNKAASVLNSFADAVSKYGLPNKIRSDLGGENQRVWEYMIDQHGSETVVVVGSSTHNERIERLWRDVQRCVAVLFGDLFRKMEEDGILDCLNEVDIFCLHTVFLPRINAALDLFVECWNNHPMTTAHNLTPNQQVIQGAMNQNMVPTFPSPAIATTGRRVPSGHDAVMVPRSTFVPCNVLKHALDQIDYIHSVDDLGYRIYDRTCQIVGNHLQTCVRCA